MISFIGRSFIQKIITLFFVSIVSFLIIHLAPGEPSQVDPLNPKFTPEMVERFREAFHLDKPLYIQYLYFYRRGVKWGVNLKPVVDGGNMAKPIKVEGRTGVFYRMARRLGGPGDEKVYYVRYKKKGKWIEAKAGRQYQESEHKG